MNVMMLTGVRQMEMQEVAPPEVTDRHDVLVRLARVGVCGSDVHYYERGKIGNQVVEYPYPVGHECAGTVEAVGADVTRVKPGDRIAVDPAMPCFACDQCRAGRTHTCRVLRFLGCPGQADGCLSEHIVMPEASCFPIPDSMTLEQAALSEPLAIGVYAVQRSPVTRGSAVGILGTGPIGLSVMLPARAEGAARIYMTDKIDARLAAARQAGADWTGNPDTEDIVAAIDAAEPDQLDVVFECCGDPGALAQAVDLLRPGGTLMVVGIPEADTITFDINKLRRKELAIVNVRRQNDCVQATLDLISSGRIRPDFMVTHRFPFERTKDAFDLVAGYRDGVVKAMITYE